MSSEFDGIARIVRKHIEAGEILGGITLVARGGRIGMLDAQGVSDPVERRPLTPDTVFSVFSMTKPIVAAAALILIEEGKLAPDDPVSKYVPEFAKPRRVRTLKPGHNHVPMIVTPDIPMPHPDPAAPRPEFDYAPAARPITVHDIISFTSGLQTIGIPNDAIPPLTPDETLASWVAKLGDAPLEFQPGTQWHYSNATGYEVLARIIEVASGEPFSGFVQRRLFDPLGMTDACFGEQPRLRDRIIPSGLMGGAPPSWTTFASGSAGVHATAENYWRFAQMLLNGGRFEGREVIPEAGIKRMTTNQIGDMPFPGVRSIEYAAPNPISHPGVRYGYGVAIIADRATSGVDLPNGSFGWDGIGTRRVWVIPALDTVLVMLMPGLGPPADATHREIESFVASSLA